MFPTSPKGLSRPTLRAPLSRTPADSLVTWRIAALILRSRWTTCPVGESTRDAMIESSPYLSGGGFSLSAPLASGPMVAQEGRLIIALVPIRTPPSRKRGNLEFDLRRGLCSHRPSLDIPISIGWLPSPPRARGPARRPPAPLRSDSVDPQRFERNDSYRARHLESRVVSQRSEVRGRKGGGWRGVPGAEGHKFLNTERAPRCRATRCRGHPFSSPENGCEPGSPSPGGRDPSNEQAVATSSSQISVVSGSAVVVRVRFGDYFRDPEADDGLS